MAQTRLRAQANRSKKAPKSNEHYNGIMHCLEVIYRLRGMKGLFQGLEAKLGQTVLTAAFMFMFYEKIVIMMRAALGDKRK